MSITLAPVLHELPAGFDVLRTEASTEGHRNMERLSTDWVSGAARFDANGERLLAAFVGAELAGIGGITVDPTEHDAFRLRRFYVRKQFRGRGIGRGLADALLRDLRGRRCVVNAGTEQAARFWEALGFVTDCRNGHTHMLVVHRH